VLQPQCCNLEVITIDLICEVCGTSNPPGTEFCTNCDSYLAWDRSAQAKPSGKPAQPTSPAPNPPPKKEWTVQAPAAGSPGGGYQGYYDAGHNQGTYDQGASGSGQSAPTMEQPADADVSCPYCGTINPGTRRFCSHCGNQLYDPNAYAGYGYWPGPNKAQDRAARKAYRRLLPPLYRWRGWIIGLVIVTLLAAAVVALGRDPVDRVTGTWYYLRQKYEWVKPVSVRVVPAEATAAGSNPAALVDESENEWTMIWTPSGAPPMCGPAPGTGYVIFTFAPTRIRLLQIAPGLSEKNPQRSQQPVPRVLGIFFEDGRCHRVPLTGDPGQQEIKIDSKKPVTQMIMTINSVTTPPNGRQLISFTEVILKDYPSGR
jgi:hypothetical protein